jgi:VanZ family protein
VHRLIRPAAVAFAVFIVVTIYAANTGTYHPGIALVRWLPYGDKVGHLTLWGVLTLLINLATPGRSVRLGRWPIPLGTAVLIAVVVAEEASQRWLDNRTLDPVDLVANLIGIGLATALSRVLNRRHEVKAPAKTAENQHDSRGLAGG